MTVIPQGLFGGDAVTDLAHEAHGLGRSKRPRSRAGPTVTAQIRRALVPPPRPPPDLTDLTCEE